LCGLRKDVHQRDLPNAVTKKIFKTFQGQVSVNVTDNIRSLLSEDQKKKSSKKNVQMLFIVVDALIYTWLVHRHATLNEGNKYIN